MTTQVVKRSEGIDHNEPCESCQSIGRDKTGDHLLVFADGGAYCQRCKYTRRSDGTIKNYGNLDPTDTTVSKDPEVSSEDAQAMLTEAPSTSIVFGTTTPESPASYPSDKIRSIPQDVVDLYGVRVSYDPADRSITHHYYPMRSKGDLITWKVRETNTKKFYKLSKSGKAMDFFGQELAKGKIPKALLICEGELDAMASCEMLKRMDVLCVSLPSGANTKVIQDHLPWLQKIPKVVLAYDQDEPGEDNVAATWELLPGVCVMKFSEKDPCDMLSNLKTLEFIDSFTNADPYKPRTIIETGSLVDSLATPVPLGLSYPWDGLTEITYGIQLNTIVGLGAAPGAGKTTVVKGIQSHLMLHHGQKIGIVSLEESSELTLRAMVGYEMGKQIHIPGQAYDTAEAQRVARSLDDLCYIYDHKYYDGSWDEIESAIRYLYSTGVRYFFIDPLSALVSHLSASDANQYLSKAMFSMSKLVQALDLTVFHVNHLNSPSGKAHEEGGRVFGSAFTGSRSQYRYSNLLLGMERNQLADSESERNLMTVRIIKDRLTGGTGKSVPLKYLHSTGKLEEVKPTTSFA